MEAAGQDHKLERGFRFGKTGIRTRYLPEMLDGNRVLFPQGGEQTSCFKVVQPESVDYPWGLVYFNSPDQEDTTEFHEAWGNEVEGTLKDGWLVVEHPENWRDVFHQGDIDSGCRALAACLGWSADLEALIEKKGAIT